MPRVGLTLCLRDQTANEFLRDDGEWAPLASGGDLSAAWPVGSVFITVVATNPATLLGLGTWAVLAAGRFLVGVDIGQTDFDTVEKTGGSKTVTLTTAEMPSHSHGVTDSGHTHGQSIRNSGTAGTAGTQGASTANNATAGLSASATTGIAVQATGGGLPFSVLPPYICCFMWKRVS